MFALFLSSISKIRMMKINISDVCYQTCLVGNFPNIFFFFLAKKTNVRYWPASHIIWYDGYVGVFCLLMSSHTVCVSLCKGLYYVKNKYLFLLERTKDSTVHCEFVYHDYFAYAMRNSNFLFSIRQWQVKPYLTVIYN